MGLFNWTEKTSATLDNGGVIAPDERLPWPQTTVMGVQHVIAMFGATVLAPLLMGFNPNVAILMSGIGTLIFFFITGGKVPSYLGSSFAFIGVVIAASGYAGPGPNANLGVALGGIIACGALYFLIGLIVQAVGYTRFRRHMLDGATPIGEEGRIRLISSPHASGPLAFGGAEGGLMRAAGADVPGHAASLRMAGA